MTTRIPRPLRNYGVPLLFLMASAVFMMFFSSSTSPLYLGEWGDYSIYKYIGLGMLDGKLPYLDLFDNKGVLLYAINALGQCVPAMGRWGLYLLQTLCMAFSLWMLYRTAAQIVSPRKAVLSTLVAFLLLGGLYQGGDHVEEWMLPFLSSCLYLTIRLVRDYTTKNLYLLALVGGLSVGCVCLLRPNDAAALGLGTAIGVLLLTCKQASGGGILWRSLLVACAIVVVGMATVLLPVVLVYAHHDALPYLWNGMVQASAQMNNAWAGQFHSLLKWGKWAVLLLLVALFVMTHNVDKRLNLCLIPLGLCQLFFIGISLYAHYLIVLFPLLVLYFAMLWQQRSRQVLVLAVAILLLSHRPLPRMMLLNAAECMRGIGHLQSSERTEAIQLLKQIPEGASVWNYNLNPYNCELSPLVECRVVQCNRLVDNNHNEYVAERDFTAMKPQYVLATGDTFEGDTALCGGYTYLAGTQHGRDIRLYRANTIE